jgi:hypothetical protein
LDGLLQTLLDPFVVRAPDVDGYEPLLVEPGRAKELLEELLLRLRRTRTNDDPGVRIRGLEGVGQNGVTPLTAELRVEDALLHVEIGLDRERQRVHVRILA